jgi:hypothetical protein
MSDPKPAADDDALHRLTSRLATLDLDPPTLEILTAILTADLDLRERDVDPESAQHQVGTATT